MRWRAHLSRRFVLAAGAGLAAWPPALAQEAGRTYRLGFVVQPQRSQFGALFDELRRRGFIEGRNLVLDPRGFGLAIDELEAAAIDVAKTRPDAIYSGGASAGRAVKQATTTIPIVAASDDMIGDRIVQSLAHPGGNITGISILATELDNKRLEMLIEIVPGIRRIGALVDPGTSSSDHLQMLTAAARSLGVELSIHPVSAEREIAGAIEAARATGAQALSILASALFHANRASIIEQIRLVRLPAMYQWPEYAIDGALIAYGSRFTSMYRQAAGMLVKVITGTKPADIPVEQPTKFDLVINLKTAKELGLTVPSSLLVAADEVIE